MSSVTNNLINSSVEYLSNTTPTDVINYSVDLAKNNLFTPLGVLSWGSLACIYLIGTEQEKSDYKKVSNIFLRTVVMAGLTLGGITLVLEAQEPESNLATAGQMIWFMGLGAYQCYSMMNIGVSLLLAANAANNKLQQQAEGLGTKNNS